jgi:zinc transport system substrate-binding protein
MLRIVLMRVLLGVVLLFGATGCAAFSDTADDRVSVAAGFYPLAFIAQQVGGEDVHVTNLTEPGQEPHDLELDLRTTAEVADADLVLLLRGFQPSVDEAVDEVAEGEVLDVTDVVDLKASAEDPDQQDPHFWLDPERMALLTDAVADRLTEVDPDHAATYRENADALVAELHQLTSDFERGLDGCARNTVVVSHDAFAYLSRFGLHIEGIAGLSPDAEPTPADLARLQDLIQSEGITTVFSERLVSPRLAETLANDLGVRTAVLDPIEGLSDETANEDYLSLMRQNLAALEEANRCPNS